MHRFCFVLFALLCSTAQERVRPDCDDFKKNVMKIIAIILI